ncbi:hypothetical protein IMZ48_01705 [Candidatus Bathyarchaeota archaeon]|nr:hypothetical protein [Candidatus Bathyarchaeota archaeon]
MFNLTNEDTLPPEDLELLKHLESIERRNICVDVLKLPECDSLSNRQMASVTNQAVLKISFQETYENYVGVWVFMCVDENQPPNARDDGTILWPGKLSIMPLKDSDISEIAPVRSFDVTNETCSLHDIIEALREWNLDVFDFIGTSDKYYHGGDRDYM